MQKNRNLVIRTVYFPADPNKSAVVNPSCYDILRSKHVIIQNFTNTHIS
jgi:hypothetical protein